MYTKEELKQLKLDFWSSLEKELATIKNPHGSKVNWMNYNTGVRNLYFRIEADDLGAKLCIDMQQRDTGTREVLWEQFNEFKDKLDHLFNNQLVWQKSHVHTNGLVISRIYILQTDVSLLRREDWPTIYSFAKDNFGKLNRFWFEFQDLFKALMS